MDLHEACYQGALDVVRQFLAAGADPNAPAAPSGREWISVAGPNPRPLNCVAVAWRMTDDHVEIARMLIAHGATVDDSVLRDHLVEAEFGNPCDLALRSVLEAARGA